MMRDEELWHADNNRLSKDQRDDRRDAVTGETGPIGFANFDEEEQERKEQERQRKENDQRDADIGNEVETFTDEFSENDGKPEMKDMRETATRPLPEGSEYRQNRETAKFDLSSDRKDPSTYTLDQVTPPDESIQEPDGAKLRVKPSSERNEPDRKNK